MTDSDPSDYVLKVPEGNSVGITPELRRWIETNGRLELFGELIEPGHGTTTKEYVPVEALQELVDEWRDNNSLRATLSGHEKSAEAHAKRECANELEALIEDYQ